MATIDVHRLHTLLGREGRAPNSVGVGRSPVETARQPWKTTLRGGQQRSSRRLISTDPKRRSSVAGINPSPCFTQLVSKKRKLKLHKHDQSSRKKVQGQAE